MKTLANSRLFTKICFEIDLQLIAELVSSLVAAAMANMEHFAACEQCTKVPGTELVNKEPEMVVAVVEEGLANLVAVDDEAAEPGLVGDANTAVGAAVGMVAAETSAAAAAIAGAGAGLGLL